VDGTGSSLSLGVSKRGPFDLCGWRESDEVEEVAELQVKGARTGEGMN